MSHRRLFAFAILLCAALDASPGHATTWYVAGTGSSNSCIATSPCFNINDAINIAASGDKVVCLSPPGGEGISINKSITIDCRGVEAVFGEFPHTASDNVLSVVVIHLPANDPYQTVRLRGLNIDNLGTIPHSLGGRGITIESAAAVYIEDCVIANAELQGILDRRTGGQTKLFVKNTVVSGNGGAGIVAVSAAVGITVLDNVSSERNTYGIAVGAGNNVSIKNSVFSGNSVAGVEGDAGSHIMVSNSTVTHNNVGIQSASSVRFFSNDISFNNTAFSGLAASSGFNRYDGNVSIGTAPSPVPNAPADIGP